MRGGEEGGEGSSEELAEREAAWSSEGNSEELAVRGAAWGSDGTS